MSRTETSSLSRNRPRLAIGPDSVPGGHLCDKCEQREASTAWGDAMTINHGGGEWRCQICALIEQLEFARKRAAVIPVLEAQLIEAQAKAVPLVPPLARADEHTPSGSPAEPSEPSSRGRSET